MRKKDYTDKMADELVKRSEEAKKLKRIGSKASGLASLLTQKPKADLLRKEVMKRLPVTFMNLSSRKRFYEKGNKSKGNVVNIDKEIDKCEKYLDMIENDITVEVGIEILDWTDKINTKYGFETS